jgi:hypothetical protein
MRIDSFHPTVPGRDLETTRFQLGCHAWPLQPDGTRMHDTVGERTSGAMISSATPRPLISSTHCQVRSAMPDALPAPFDRFFLM